MSGAVDALSDRVLHGMLSEAPDLALNAGIFEVAGRALPADAVPDYSEEGEDRRQRMVRDWSAELRAIPQVAGAGEDLTREVMAYVLERGFYNRFAGLRGHGLTDHIDPVTPGSGVHAAAMDMLVRDQPLDTPDDAEIYVARLARLPAAIEAATGTLKARRAKGFVAAEPVLARAIADITGSLTDGAEAHLFVRRLRGSLNGKGGALGDLAASIVGGPLRPAYAGLLDELDRHLAVAGPDASARRRPRGDEFYAWRFAGHTTTDVSPQEAHALGREELARVQGELDAILADLGLHGPRGEALQAAAADHPYADDAAGREEVLRAARETLQAGREIMRPQFNLWPRAEAVVLPIEPENETSRHSTYVPPRAGSGAEGIFWLNLRQAIAAPRWENQVVCVHEVWPGHHLQIALAQELPLPAFRRAMLFAAYLEGWAKYAEILGETSGVLAGPFARLARLRTELYSTCTLVIDTGMHALGWSMDEARDVFARETGASGPLAEMVALRSASQPGHLSAYKMGMLKVLELRRRYETARGPAFRIQDFHDLILGHGALPLALLERVVDAALAAPREAAHG